MTELTKTYTLSELENMVEDMPDGRAMISVDCPELNLVKGTIYATPGVCRYWVKKKAGLVHHEPRGPDINVRKNPAQKTVALRYRQQTGRRIEDDMEQEQLMVKMMFECATQMSDPQERFAALRDANKAQNSFNKTWAPYLEHKLGVLNTVETVEDKISLDDVLNGDG